jgi:cytidine deaminase
LIGRDETDESDNAFGQDVRNTYAMADVYLPAGRGRDVMEDVERFVHGLFGAPFITPSAAEEAMLHAHEAGLRSAAVGRQVGAALIPASGAAIICGTNEVPKPGGGQYRTGDRPDHRDFRSGSDPNQTYVGMTVQELLERQADQGWLVDGLRELSGADLLRRAREPDEEGRSILAGARAGALIEFTRCLHAEQAAIADAARAGVSTQDAILYTTTFPCHECAKFIVGAGIVAVHYIEPYPKSLVQLLYSDLIDTRPAADADDSRLPGGRVPFRPFVGIAPRRYNAVFAAGERRSATGLASINYGASPRTSGWSEDAVASREEVAISSVTRILQVLADAKPVSDGDSKATQSEVGVLLTDKQSDSESA